MMTNAGALSSLGAALLEPYSDDANEGSDAQQPREARAPDLAVLGGRLADCTYSMSLSAQHFLADRGMCSSILRMCTA